jgi:uncharacterized protein (TIGR02145 family)
VLTIGAPIRAQVTIGANIDPNEGSLLDLKTSDESVNATKGLLLPRVQLTDLTKLYPMFTGNYDPAENAKHVGLTVYNMKGITWTGVPSGLYVWDGAKWSCINVKPTLATCDPLYYEPDVTKYVDITVKVPDEFGNSTGTKNLRFLTYNLGANPNMTVKEQMAYVSTMTKPEEDITVFGGLYQWGRKDPEHSLRCSMTDKPGSFTTTRYSTAEAAAAGGQFVHGNNDWLNPAVTTLWGNGLEIGSGGNDSPVKNTAYDPCPPGYRVPTQYEWALLGNEDGYPDDNIIDGMQSITASGKLGFSGIVWVPVSEGKASTSWSGGKTNGFALYDETVWNTATEKTNLIADNAPEPLLFLPAGGYRPHNSADLVSEVGNYGRYWSSVVSSSSSQSNGMHFEKNAVEMGIFSFRCALGLSVRCVAEW